MLRSLVQRTRTPHPIRFTFLLSTSAPLSSSSVRLSSSSLSSAPLASASLPSSPAAADKRKSIYGYNFDDLKTALRAEFPDIPDYRTLQIFTAIYKYGVTDFGLIHSLSKDLRAQLAERFTIPVGLVSQHSTSVDGTEKWLIDLQRGQAVEAVFIPGPGVRAEDRIAAADRRKLNESVGERKAALPLQRGKKKPTDAEEDDPAEADNGAVCISSQVGCSLTCAFCHTGTMSKSNLRNLTTSEIVGQVMRVKQDLGDFSLLERRVSNIVLMGMGEPLYNYTNVKKALEILSCPEGLAYGRRRVTVSTSGVVPAIDKLGRDIGCNLAVSLHAVSNDVRDRIMPINKTFPLRELLAACKRYPGIKPSRRLTFEYVMLKGVNDSLAEARELYRLLRDIPSLINLIPFNPWPGAPFQSSSDAAITQFAKTIENLSDQNSGAPVKVTIRWPRGRDIGAACGQLAVKKLADDMSPSSKPTSATSKLLSPFAAKPRPAPADYSFWRSCRRRFQLNNYDV